MKKFKSKYITWNNSLIWGVYLVVIIIALLLNKNSNGCGDNIAITAGMLIIVAVIFAVTSKKFYRLSKMVFDLNEVSERIKDSVENGNNLSVKNSGIVFKDKLLAEQYKEFVDNYERLERKNPIGYKGNIEDYINYSIVDTIITRNVTNLVAGTMTGLGILGTFIGLSLGLQSFNLSSDTDQITSSIDSLMEGIKVAFHTSIYGMILSLAFNLAYKREIEIGNEAIEKFVNTYTRYIYSDKTDDSLNDFLQFQKSQAEDLHNFTQSFSTDILNVFGPQFDKMNDVIEEFTSVASEKQVEGIDAMVNNFIESLNSSMGQNFSELGTIIAKSTDLQKDSAEKLLQAMDVSKEVLANVDEINKCATKTVSELEGYLAGIEELQKVVNTNLTTLNAQIETMHMEGAKREEFLVSLEQLEKNVVEAEENYISRISDKTEEMTSSIKNMADVTVSSIREAVSTLSESVENYNNSVASSSVVNATAIAEMGDKMSASIEKAANDLRESANAVNESMLQSSENLKVATQNLNTDMDKSVKTTFKHFDDNLSQIYAGMNGTITEIRTSTERVPKVVNASYDKVIAAIEQLEGVVKLMSKNNKDNKTA